MTVAARPAGCTGRRRRSACCLPCSAWSTAISAPARSMPSRPACSMFAPNAVTSLEIMGILSLIFWSLVLIVTVKYVMLIMRADNRGEGGILALMALAQRVSVGSARPQCADPDRHRRRLPVLRRRRDHAGDLGAVGGRGPRGLGARTAAIRAADQRRGDPRCCSPCSGAAPAASAASSARSWRCGSSRSGCWAYGRSCGIRSCCWRCRPATRQLCMHHGLLAFIVLGAVVLCVTGAEALYADMGHFGAQPIRADLAVLRAALPGAELFRPGRAADLPTRRRRPIRSSCSAPQWTRLPMVILATAATVIASQAMISGAYSMARQCMQLGFLPRMTVRHTSNTEEGQIYVPQVNGDAGDRRADPGAVVQDLGQPGRGLRHRGDRHVPLHQHVWRWWCSAGSSTGRG